MGSPAGSRKKVLNKQHQSLPEEKLGPSGPRVVTEENDGFLGSTPYGWTRYSAMRDSDEFALLDLRTKKAIAHATIGEEAYEAFKASLGKRL